MASIDGPSPLFHNCLLQSTVMVFSSRGMYSGGGAGLRGMWGTGCVCVWGGQESKPDSSTLPVVGGKRSYITGGEVGAAARVQWGRMDC